MAWIMMRNRGETHVTDSLPFGLALSFQHRLYILPSATIAHFHKCHVLVSPHRLDPSINFHRLVRA